MNYVLKTQRAGDQLQAAHQLLSTCKAVLLDWDGCIAFGDQPQPQALAFLSEWRHRLAIVSNNSTRLPQEFADILARSGVDIDPSRILLAGAEALHHAATLNARRVMVIGSSHMQAYGQALGLNLADESAGLIVLLRDPGFSYAKLAVAANALRDGARLIVANPDKTHPGPGGVVVPETGALLAALLACADSRKLDMQIIGKPSANLFARACVALNVAPEQAVMIGDNPATDIAGAHAFGAHSLLIDAHGGLCFADLIASYN